MRAPPAATAGRLDPSPSRGRCTAGSEWEPPTPREHIDHCDQDPDNAERPALIEDLRPPSLLCSEPRTRRPNLIDCPVHPRIQAHKKDRDLSRRRGVRHFNLPFTGRTVRASPAREPPSHRIDTPRAGADPAGVGHGRPAGCRTDLGGPTSAYLPPRIRRSDSHSGDTLTDRPPTRIHRHEAQWPSATPPRDTPGKTARGTKVPDLVLIVGVFWILDLSADGG